MKICKSRIIVRALALMVIFQAAVITAGAQTDTTVVANSTVVTQTAARYGYLSYQEALESMPQYAMVQKQMENLRSQYQAETLRVEEEFNRKYEEFLEGQREFPKTILQKRQTELQQLMEKNIEFKANSLKELDAAEKEAMAPLRLRLNDVLREIGIKKGYAFIYDTDTKALPFLNPEMGDNINLIVKDALQ
ncbi:MAG: OmpH family outer membrane protein [Prevotella sp.]|nr:OmpH family outer membrane protein [Prevotella sp.]